MSSSSLEEKMQFSWRRMILSIIYRSSQPNPYDNNFCVGNDVCQQRRCFILLYPKLTSYLHTLEGYYLVDCKDDSPKNLAITFIQRFQKRPHNIFSKNSISHIKGLFFIIFSSTLLQYCLLPSRSRPSSSWCGSKDSMLYNNTLVWCVNAFEDKNILKI